MNHDLLIALGALGVIIGLFLIGGVVFVASIRIAARMDFDRIRSYVTSRGGHLRSCQRAYFGTGWLGSGSERIYEIRYTEANGSEHRATCKTSMLSGVYFTENRVVSGPNTPPPIPPADSKLQRMEAENRRLREEIEKLKSNPTAH